MVREHLVEHAPERVDVGARVDGLALRLLGREVRGGADHRRGLRRRGVALHPRDAEVHHLHLAGARDHHVRGLDVAVHDAVRVRGLQRRRDLLGELDGLHRRGRAAGREERRERAPLDVLHHDVLRVAVGAGVEDAHDVRVVQARRGLRLTAEPRDESGVAVERVEEDLDRDGAVERRVEAPEDLGHPALADPGLDGVALADR